MSQIPESSKISVDNFVDILSKRPSKPEKSRVSLDCPSKRQFDEIHINQSLSIARCLIAKSARQFVSRWRVLKILCITPVKPVRKGVFFVLADGRVLLKMERPGHAAGGLGRRLR